jgi:hypothetical protein
MQQGGTSTLLIALTKRNQQHNINSLRCDFYACPQSPSSLFNKVTKHQESISLLHSENVRTLLQKKEENSHATMPAEDSNKDEHPSRRKLNEEQVIYNTFIAVIRNKLSATTDAPIEHNQGNQSTEDRLKRLDELYNNRPAYEAEKALLNGMSNHGVMKGLTCGLLTLGFLRRGPRFFQRYLNRNRNQMHDPRTMNNSGGYAFDRPATAMAGSGNMASAPKPGLFFRTFKLGLDLIVSVSVASWTTALFTDYTKMLKDAAKIPLVKGRSLISDELCDDFIDVYRGIPKKTWTKNEGKPAIDAIGGFVMNCMRRQVAEKEIMEQNRSFGILDEKDEKHAEIPSPGVSPDIHVEVQWGDKSLDLDVGRDPHEDEDFFDSDSFFDSSEEDENDRYGK